MKLRLFLAALATFIVRAAAFAQILPSDFPSLTTTFDSTRVAEGALFFSNLRITGTQTGSYLIIASNDGTPLFYRAMPSQAFDFRLQPNGWLTYGVNPTHRFYALDSNFAIVDSFSTGNGAVTSMHDLLLLPNGHALLLGQETTTMDMSKIVSGGNPSATVFADRIQEIDGNGNVVFDWDGLQHFNIQDTRLVPLTAATIDMQHSNSIDLDTDGNIVLSSRHFDEVTKIDRTTGDVIWRFGGAHNQFRLIGDTLWFSHQHDVRRIANGNITMFDNGNGHTPKVSRALEYRLNTNSMTATLVWSYVPPQKYFSAAMGSVQRLPNGNTLIGYGDVPLHAADEIAPDGTNVFSLTMGNKNISYRTLRYPWKSSAQLGVPMTKVLNDDALTVFPSPTTMRSMVYFDVPATGTAKLSLYDACGRLVSVLADGRLGEGHHSVVFDASELPSGAYHVALITERGIATMQVPVIR